MARPLDRLGRALRSSEDARRPRIPVPDRGPFRREFWSSPLRDLWLSSFLSAVLLPLFVVTAVTGFLSHAAYDPALGNSQTGGFEQSLYFFSWPTDPEWLYALNQGLHVLTGLAAIPFLLAKLWAVVPKLYERPVARSVSHALERVNLSILVGSGLMVLFTGVFNIQYWYATFLFGFFIPAHYYAAIAFVAALGFHVLLKLPAMAESFRDVGFLAPLRTRRELMRVASPERSLSSPTDPQPATVSRRGLLATVAAGSLGLVALTIGQSLGGFLRPTALLAPRGRAYGDGPNDFQINQPAEAAGIKREDVDQSWRLLVEGPRRLLLRRDELLAMPLVTERLPIACVEGWTTYQTWTGVRLRDLAAMAGADGSEELAVQSIERGGFGSTVLNSGQVQDPQSLLALKVNGADLSLDHGFPARIIVPALPGVRNTKWIAKMTFRQVQA